MHEQFYLDMILKTDLDGIDAKLESQVHSHIHES